MIDTLVRENALLNYAEAALLLDVSTERECLSLREASCRLGVCVRTIRREIDRGRRKTLGTELGKAGVPIRVAMELMRHSDVKFTTKIYTNSGMLPIWYAVGALPMFNDTQIDTQTLVVNSQNE